MRAWRSSLLVAGALVVLASPAGAQQLNNRKAADPGTDANTARLLSRASLQAKKEDGDTLKRDDAKDLVVNTDCGPVQIGGQQADNQAGKPDSLIGTGNATNAQNNTVVNGDVVNICRR